MELKPTVRAQLQLARDLLTNSDYLGLQAQDRHHIAHDVLLACDAVELALTAICDQLGYPLSQRSARLAVYLQWLENKSPGGEIGGKSLVTALEQARADLRFRCAPPEPSTWTGVRQRALDQIESWCGRYLDLPLDGLELPRGSENCLVRDVSDEAGFERRGSPRYACAGDAQVRVPFGGPAFAGRLLNLSLGGCYVQMESPFELGRLAEVTLRVNKLSFRARGKVVFSESFRSDPGDARPRSGMGIRFTGMSEGGRRRLRELIEEFAHTRAFGA